MRNAVLFSLAIALLLSSCALSQMDSGSSGGNSSPSKTPYEPGGYGWTLVWSDEFDGTNVDTSNWAFDTGTGSGGWGNNELEYYTSSTNNVFVTNGSLFIRALQETTYGTAYTSARLKTQGKHTWAYGKIIAKIKMPYGQGIWPSFWMLGNSYNGANWPDCGEMVIAEMYGGTNTSNQTSYASLYWRKFGVITEYREHTNIGEPLHNDFHMYEIEWNSNLIVARIDGNLYFSYNISSSDCDPFRSPFFILLNLAVGGNWAGNPDGTTVFPQTMEVDWVRVYQKDVSVPLAVVTYPQNLTTIYGRFPVVGYSQSSYPVTRTCVSVDHSDFTGVSNPTNWTNFLNLTAGSHNLRIYTQDVSNRFSMTNEMDITVTWDKPKILFTSVPAFNSTDRVYGTVTGVSPSLYKISLWIYCWWGGWWPKPYFADPYSAIQNDGTWSSLYNIAGVDGSATNFVAYLVPSYMPIFGGSGIYSEITNYIVTYGSFNRADLTGPSNVNFIDPTNGGTALGRLHTYSLSGSFLDDRGGGRVFMSINGSAFDDIPLALNATNWCVDRTFVEGSNTISVFIADDGYHYSETNQIRFYFVNDDTPPSIQVTSPQNGEHYPWPGSVTLSGTSGDLHGVQMIYLEMDDLGFFKANDTTNWNLVWPFLDSGVHTLKYYGTDILTNTTSTNIITFFVD